MKITIVNQPLNNRGDQAAHRAFVRELSKVFFNDNVNIVFLNREQEYIDKIADQSISVSYVNVTGFHKAINKAEKISLKSNFWTLSYIHPVLRKYINTIKSSDLVICAPGGICMGGFMDWSHVWQLWVAKKLNKKIIYWGRSIGPFTDEDKEHSLFKKRSYELIKYFQYISMRDNISYELAKSINLNTVKAIDSAFLETPRAEIDERLKKEIGDKYVVFVPNELKWHYKFKDIDSEKIMDFYLDIIKALFELYPGHKIVMLPQLYCSDIADYKYFLKIKEKVNSDDVVVVDESYDSDQQQTIISGAKFLVGGRYHSIIFAINNCIPFVSLTYEHKMSGLLEMLGLSNYQIDINDVFKTEDTSEFIEKIKSISKENKNLEKENKLAKDIVNEAYEKMVEVIKER